jgi:hypothetical protein
MKTVIRLYMSSPEGERLYSVNEYRADWAEWQRLCSACQLEFCHSIPMVALWPRHMPRRDTAIWSSSLSLAIIVIKGDQAATTASCGDERRGEAEKTHSACMCDATRGDLNASQWQLLG